MFFFFLRCLQEDRLYAQDSTSRNCGVSSPNFSRFTGDALKTRARYVCACICTALGRMSREIMAFKYKPEMESAGKDGEEGGGEEGEARALRIYTRQRRIPMENDAVTSAFRDANRAAPCHVSPLCHRDHRPSDDASVLPHTRQETRGRRAFPPAFFSFSFPGKTRECFFHVIPAPLLYLVFKHIAVQARTCRVDAVLPGCVAFLDALSRRWGETCVKGAVAHTRRSTPWFVALKHGLLVFPLLCLFVSREWGSR